MHGTENTFGFAAVSWGVQCVVCLDHFASSHPVSVVETYFDDGHFYRWEGVSQRIGQRTITITGFWPLVARLKSCAPTESVGISIDSTRQVRFYMDGFQEAYQEWFGRVAKDFPGILNDEGGTADTA